MQTRPSVIRINKRCVKRRTFGNCLLFCTIVMLLLCVKADIVLAMLVAGGALLAIRLFECKK